MKIIIDVVAPERTSEEFELDDLKNKIAELFPSVTDIRMTIFGEYRVISYDQVIGIFYLSAYRDRVLRDFRYGKVEDFKFI